MNLKYLDHEIYWVSILSDFIFHQKFFIATNIALNKFWQLFDNCVRFGPVVFVSILSKTIGFNWIQCTRIYFFHAIITRFQARLLILTLFGNRSFHFDSLNIQPLYGCVRHSPFVFLGLVSTNFDIQILISNGVKVELK